MAVITRPVIDTQSTFNPGDLVRTFVGNFEAQVLDKVNGTNLYTLRVLNPLTNEIVEVTRVNNFEIFADIVTVAHPQGV